MMAQEGGLVVGLEQHAKPWLRRRRIRGEASRLGVAPKGIAV